MKNILNQFVLFVFGIFFFTACSKEKIAIPGSSSSTATTRNTTDLNSSRVIPVTTGSIKGKLFPAPEKAVIIAYNDQFSSTETIVNSDGTFNITDLEPGYYSLSIKYVARNADDYAGITIPKIPVKAGLSTDLGNIYL